MSKDPDVYLIPSRVNDTIEWTWLYKGGYGSGKSVPPIYLDKDSGSNKITFTVFDPLNQIKFDSTPVGNVPNAIWIVKKIPGAQKKAGVEQNDQIGPNDINLDTAKTQLTVKDKNSGDPVDFLYQLNFVNSQTNQPVTAIDPELKNGGGTQPPMYSAMEVALVGLVAAALAAIVSLSFVRMRARAGKPQG